MTESAPPPPERVSAEERKRLLTEQVRLEVARGARIESQGQYDTIVATGNETNNTAHLIATIATCGAWGLVWLVIYFTGGVKRKMIVVDDYGNVLVQKIQTK